MKLSTWFKTQIAIHRKQRELRRINEHIRWMDDQIASGQFMRKKYAERKAILSAELNALLPPHDIIEQWGRT